MQKLTERQKRFIDFYVETGNATEACKKAGYRGKNLDVIASQNLGKLSGLINIKLKSKEDERIASQDEVLRYLTSVLRGEVEEECVVVEGVGEGCSRAAKIRKEVTPKDRNKAAELLAKRYGLLKENIELSGSVGVTIVDDVK